MLVDALSWFTYLNIVLVLLKVVLCAMLVASVFTGLSYVCIAVKADSKLFITLKNRHIERISSASLLNFWKYALKGVPSL